MLEIDHYSHFDKSIYLLESNSPLKYMCRIIQSKATISMPNIDKIQSTEQ